MPRRTLSIPDELDKRVTDTLEWSDSYSEVVVTALREYLDAHQEVEADD